ncbi:hypothetical protein D050_2513B, partial [Vibrio parahaemolyticus VPCR-2009]
YSD